MRTSPTPLSEFCLVSLYVSLQMYRLWIFSLYSDRFNSNKTVHEFSQGFIISGKKLKSNFFFFFAAVQRLSHNCQLETRETNFIIFNVLKNHFELCRPTPPTTFFFSKFELCFIALNFMLLFSFFHTLP